MWFHLLERFTKLPFYTAVAVLLVGGCDASTSRLDEEMLVDGSDLRLKVVRYFERLPLSYWGEVAIVQCASEATRTRPAGKANDPGWVIVDRFVAIGTRDAKEVLGKARERLVLADGKMLVWNHGLVLEVTFDGCGSFKRWDARDLPAELTLAAQLPDYCKPKGLVDCNPHDFRFIGDRMPVFSVLKASKAGDISFEVRSKAFVNGRAMRVSSSDYGFTWQSEHQ